MGVVCALYGMIGNIYVKRCVDEKGLFYGYRIGVIPDRIKTGTKRALVAALKGISDVSEGVDRLIERISYWDKYVIDEDAVREVLIELDGLIKKTGHEPLIRAVEGVVRDIVGVDAGINVMRLFNGLEVDALVRVSGGLVEVVFDSNRLYFP